MLLLFAGQVLSAPFNQCSATKGSSNATIVMQMASMEGHDMSMMQQYNDSVSDSTLKMDCCDECKCPMDMCLSQVFLSTNENAVVPLILQQSQPLNFPVFIKISQPSSIYRPPILS